jgi:hypothetical protein
MSELPETLKVGADLCRPQESSEFVRLDFDKFDGVPGFKELVILLSREIEPLIIGVGEVLAYETPKRLKVISRDGGGVNNGHVTLRSGTLLPLLNMWSDQQRDRTRLHVNIFLISDRLADQAALGGGALAKDRPELQLIAPIVRAALASFGGLMGGDAASAFAGCGHATASGLRRCGPLNESTETFAAGDKAAGRRIRSAATKAAQVPRAETFHRQP